MKKEELIKKMHCYAQQLESYSNDIQADIYYIQKEINDKFITKKEIKNRLNIILDTLTDIDENIETMRATLDKE